MNRRVHTPKIGLGIAMSRQRVFPLAFTSTMLLPVALENKFCFLFLFVFLLSSVKQLDIKLGPFTLDLNSVMGKIKNRKAAGLDEISSEVWKTRQFDDILLRYCDAVYNQNPIDSWMKGCIHPFPKKGDLGLAKNYRGIALTSMVAKIYNVLLRNRIQPKIENILIKNHNGFRRNRSTTSQILTICRIFEGVRAKKLTGNNIICRLYLGLWLRSQRKHGVNSTCLRPTKRNSRNHDDAL